MFNLSGGHVFSPLNQVCTNFSEIQESSENSKCQKSDLKEVPYRGPSSIRHYHTEFSHLANLAHLICLPAIK